MGTDNQCGTAGTPDHVYMALDTCIEIGGANPEFRKAVCASNAVTITQYTDNTCGTATQGATPGTRSATACDQEGNVYEQLPANACGQMDCSGSNIWPSHALRSQPPRPRPTTAARTTPMWPRSRQELSQWPLLP